MLDLLIMKLIFQQPLPLVSLLKENSKDLNEIVVTGYTSQKKKDITGSVAVVNVTSLKQIPTGSPETGFAGTGFRC